MHIGQLGQFGQQPVRGTGACSSAIGASLRWNIISSTRPSCLSGADDVMSTTVRLSSAVRVEDKVFKQRMRRWIESNMLAGVTSRNR